MRSTVLLLALLLLSTSVLSRRLGQLAEQRDANVLSRRLGQLAEQRDANVLSRRLGQLAEIEDENNVYHYLTNLSSHQHQDADQSQLRGGEDDELLAELSGDEDDELLTELRHDEKLVHCGLNGWLFTDPDSFTQCCSKRGRVKGTFGGQTFFECYSACWPNGRSFKAEDKDQYTTCCSGKAIILNAKYLRCVAQ